MGLIILLVRCVPADKSSVIQGTWKMDSLYTYYNGFGLTKYDFEEQPLRHYQANGKLMMTRGEESRLFSYKVQNNDSLIHFNLNEKILDQFLIISLDQDQLILKKNVLPVFPGNNQERYEVRYFSKVKSN